MSNCKKYLGYYYFEKPDYEDCIQKTWLSMRIAAGIATLQCMNHLIKTPIRISNYSYMARKLGYYMFPWLSLAYCGAAGTCVLAKLRGNKDDCYNYLFGWGVSSGLIFTHLFKGSGRGAACGAATGLLFVYFKKADMGDYIINNESMQTYESRAIQAGVYAGKHWSDWRGVTSYLILDDPGRKPDN